MRRTLPVMSVVLVLLPAATVAAQDLFDLQPVADGVHAAVARPQHKVNSNAAVVVLEEGVLVVDSHSKPSAARALVEQVRRVSDKPVKWVVNTHFHWDHYQGNEAYTSAWPAGVEVLSSTATWENIERLGLPRVKRELADLPKEIQTLREALAQAGAAERPTARDRLEQAERYLQELRSMRLVLPTVTFDRSLVLRRPSRTVHLIWAGRGHTDGDVVVYLPKERVLITGDLIQAGIPFMGDGYPYDWVKTLEQIEQLDFRWLVGGHGAPLEGKAQFALYREYFNDLLQMTTAAYTEGLALDAARTRVADALFAKYEKRFARTPTHAGVAANVSKAWRVISGQQD